MWILKRRRVLPGCVLALTALLGACGGGGGREEPLETVDVGPALEVATEGDLKEKPRPEGLVGLLPGGFPEDLPLYLPASVVDFGPTEGERRGVALLTPHELGRVGGELEALLERQGWQVAETDGEGRRTLTKGGRRAWLELSEGHPGTLYRYEYLPR